MSGSCKFILSKAGHIGGVITHPRHNKYGYWENGSQGDPDMWMKTAQYKAGSWWSCWLKWILSRTVITHSLSEKNTLTLGSAPGTYVRVKYNDSLFHV